MKSVDVPKWLEKLPLAPEFHPTDTEFADPIAYISKIEKEASAFGICKIIPPFPKPSKKYVLHNLNKSLSKCPELDPNVSLVTRSNSDTNTKSDHETKVNGGESRAVFTTRQQELGCEKGKKDKGSLGDSQLGAQKHVWQSGEVYTLEQFEAKSKNFAKSQLGSVKDVNPLVIETMFWKANSEKPIYVEYANDVPGSGFGEPEGLLKYFHRRRRKRKRNSFGHNKLASLNINKDQVGLISSVMTDKDSDNQNPDMFTEEVRNSSETGQSHETASISGRNSFQCSSEMEGTAGWKLSNSPWNLQVIARSPGSLTRFMPDDIPGVTSPMVYVGMLYSWFAWHVEDHELHSLNFLHMGSSKTWYAVPADYALDFEEVVRLHVFGKETDRLVALSLLGEKTTVLSPETIVASGLPCCRLVQNPGEFVVTFPRAYHVGFSHGFNCGEAANFGTPKWLTIAKKAAVRRAAMNHLPMLSHQQLLYLLTMSFLSRIPRSLLPGVRSSRLRDRQKEHRELLVKRAFIEDILHENSQLNVLLQRNSAYRTVLWDVESLLSLRKESECCKDTDVVMLTSEENNYPENDATLDRLSKLSEFIGAVDFDLYDDDLAYDFETESGTLPCVACGILGFPFMAVVQPSEEASRNLFHLDLVTASVESEESSKDPMNNTAAKTEKSCVNEASSLGTETSQTTRLAVNKSVVADQCTSSNCESVSLKDQVANGWNISNLSLRPRIFCLEHAIQVEELLSLKGGANVIVICHSDFQKIVSHAGMISEEIGVPFSYTEIPLGNASKEDLNLIDISIEREDQDNNSAEDWSSELCVNLRHYVKVKRSSLPSKSVRHLLDLGGLFSAAPSISKASDVEWISRKLRSNRRQNLQSKPLDRSNKIVEEDLMKTNEELQIVSSLGSGKIIKEDEEKKVASNGDAKIIQYSRRRFKSGTSSGKETPTCLKETDKGDEIDGRSLCSTVENNGDTSLDPSSQASNSKAGSHRDDAVLLSEKGLVEDHDPSNCINSTGVSTAVTENLEAPPRTCVVYRSEEVAGSCCESQLKISGNMNDKDKNSFETVELASNENVKELPQVSGISREEETVDESGGACKSHSTERDSEVSDNAKFDESRLCNESTSNQLVINNKEPKCSHEEECERVQRDSEYKRDMVSECMLPINESTSLNEATLPGEADSVIRQNDNDGESVDDEVFDDLNADTMQSKITEKAQRKRKREVQLLKEDHFDPNSFIRSPCEGLRPRTKASLSSLPSSSNSGTHSKKPAHETQTVKKPRKATDSSTPSKDKKVNPKGHHQYKCGIDTCTMSFQTKSELRLHEGNQCPVEGCRKKFNSHKYAVQHQRVHDDDRPLKCPWKGCTVSFKWAWARTEHLRVHTGERPYECKVDGCGLTFRFVSDFSRHRRKTGHYVDQ